MGHGICLAILACTGGSANPHLTSFECSFKNSQKDFLTLKLMDVSHVMSIQTDGISGEQCIRYGNFM